MNYVKCVAKAFSFIEHFAGQGAMTRAVAEVCRVPAAKLDLDYHRGLDIATSSGFAMGPENCTFLSMLPCIEVFRNLVISFEASSGIGTSRCRRGIYIVAGDVVLFLGEHITSNYHAFLATPFRPRVPWMRCFGKYYAVKACWTQSPFNPRMIL